MPREELRQSPRKKVAAPYSLLRVRPKGEGPFHWMGHIYDISSTGMRLELDNPIEPGTEVEVRAMLPGPEHPVIQAQGCVVRLVDEEHHGPTRMGMSFSKFKATTDKDALEAYLSPTIVSEAA
jgi:hypothetical protein